MASRREIFSLDYQDFTKFYQYLYLFNDANYSNAGNEPLHNDVLLAGHEILQSERKSLVDIVSFCIMTNHFHLFVRQREEDGIARFLHKLQLGFAKYFNRRYDRRGRLFESTYHAVLVEDDVHFLHMPRYVHMNALDVSEPGWREGSVKDWVGARLRLEQYPWSSHRVYLGHGQELPVVNEDEVRRLFQNPRNYEQFLQEWAQREVPGNLVTSEVT